MNKGMYSNMYSYKVNEEANTEFKREDFESMLKYYNNNKGSLKVSKKFKHTLDEMTRIFKEEDSILYPLFLDQVTELIKEVEE